MDSIGIFPDFERIYIIKLNRLVKLTNAIQLHINFTVSTVYHSPMKGSSQLHFYSYLAEDTVYLVLCSENRFSHLLHLSVLKYVVSFNFVVAFFFNYFFSILYPYLLFIICGLNIEPYLSVYFRGLNTRKRRRVVLPLK